ncbi:MAG: hypothetical protein COZ75_09705 [Flavobacteriaceae bacterium CG_4_8_14_3_um_filter_34_10]|nr:hypothetical protein [Flavobacteriia bacterium]OIP50710.1 MAG: hypothetical protein AUK33_07085 [Flavobacteriaceae bacterium CG2_30_34_30]PIQ18093.1 MAG: hypothetical protein COW66_08110 [Flavobacteriaceae bacterium CG18_big_fil_WC_8_21_14_2_50_34_36]PIV51272.1 MAG: hypothetical protein COS19_01695 [Flavobacteriaceae bacterium CG02_land_8_20_14_3_00_34_13]PIX08885.1 MAG: hypothetical protein COZ75_09705 [Flavobacteriaceae bacterium CG_4_8_14_3_um_filter_34_10]PIZ08596.1 MAG: hypothetical pr
MRKDIHIPKVKDVFIVAVKEWDTEFLSQNWFVYLINDGDKSLEITMVVSRGYTKNQKTATLRHAFGLISPKSFKKIELLMEEVFTFTNEFLVTYFIGETLFEKTFVFPPNTILEKNQQVIPILDVHGVLAI